MLRVGKDVAGGLKLALVGDAPENPFTILLTISGDDHDDGILSNQMGRRGNPLDLSRSGTINNARATSNQHALVESAGRTAQYRPPAIATAAGVPGENARIAALALLILGLRQG